MGAYQDIMGDVHNLFARVNEVHVFSDIEEDNGFYIEEIIKGNTVAEVLSGIQYNPAELVKKVKLMFDVQVKNGQIKPKDAVDFLNFFEKSMNEYTYLNS
jgi:arginine decarboxylase